MRDLTGTASSNVLLGMSAGLTFQCHGASSNLGVVSLRTPRIEALSSQSIAAVQCIGVCALGTGLAFAQRQPTNLVDPASSHMLVSKIKPCMSQYKLLHGETANGSLKQL